MIGAKGNGREAVEESVKMSDEDILVVVKQSPSNLDVVFCVCGGLGVKNNCKVLEVEQTGAGDC